eukprot:Nitzschia sp. Nitz4//scaffold24_size164493//106056//107387//NITZ4_002337-RA/size164493-processed-gene-0.238-mRNA-1//-1//CDS//3329544141//5473//frame0
MRRHFSSSIFSGRIAIALSGGVDSSVAAFLLKQRFQEGLLGIHMSNWDYNSEDTVESTSKCWEQDWKDAKAVAEHLDIPIVHTSFEADYWTSVFEPYINQISKNTTPNPDVDCNRHIKFGVLKEYLWSRYQIKTLATGHYARTWDPLSGNPRPSCLENLLDQQPEVDALVSRTTPILLAAKDASKDQSYFLSGVRGEALRDVLFPLGDLVKKSSGPIGHHGADPTVRDLAVEADLPTANKKDSMGICFVGKRKHGEFVQDFLDLPSVDEEGTCINVDDGKVVATFDVVSNPSLLYSTIGQGAKIGGASQKWFIVDKPEPTTLLLCPGTHHPALYSDSFYVESFNWVTGKEPPLPLKAQCRIRHLQPLMDCEIRQSGTGYEITTAAPFRGIAPGQVCGLYVDGLICLGGGAIVRRGPNYMELNKNLPDQLHPAGRNDLSTSKSR